MNNDLISRSALMPLFVEKANTMKDRHGVKIAEKWLLDYDDIKEVVDNAPSIPLPDFKEGYKQAIIDGKTNFSRPQGELAEKLKDRIEESVCKYCQMNRHCELCEISRVFQIITLTAEEQKGGAV